MKCQAGLGLASQAPLLSAPQGEPGADGAAGKEVPLCWASRFLSGMLLLAPGFALTPLHSLNKCSLYVRTISGCIHRQLVPLLLQERNWGLRRGIRVNLIFHSFFFSFKPYAWSKKANDNNKVQINISWGPALARPSLPF